MFNIRILWFSIWFLWFSGSLTPPSAAWRLSASHRGRARRLRTSAGRDGELVGTWTGDRHRAFKGSPEKKCEFTKKHWGFANQELPFKQQKEANIC